MKHYSNYFLLLVFLLSCTSPKVQKENKIRIAEELMSDIYHGNIEQDNTLLMTKYLSPEEGGTFASDNENDYEEFLDLLISIKKSPKLLEEKPSLIEKRAYLHKAHVQNQKERFGNLAMDELVIVPYTRSDANSFPLHSAPGSLLDNIVLVKRKKDNELVYCILFDDDTKVRSFYFLVGAPDSSVGGLAAFV